MLEFVDAIMAYFAQIRDPAGREGAGIGSQLSVTLRAFETVDVEERPNATTKPLQQSRYNKASTSVYRGLFTTWTEPIFDSST